MRPTFRTALFSGLVAVAGGCATVLPPPMLLGTSTRTSQYVYRDGWGAEHFAQPPERVEEALRDGLADLRMTGVHKEASGKGLVFDAVAHDRRHTRIAIQPGADGTTVAVRVGRSGDEALTKVVLERVGVRLGTRPPTPIPSEIPSETSTAQGHFSRDAVPDSVMLSNQLGSGYQDSPAP